MREIVVISGKGGTGKTSITASFGYLEAENVVVADCDVDAANMHLLLDATKEQEEDFFSGEVAFIEEKIVSIAVSVQLPVDLMRLILTGINTQ